MTQRLHVGACLCVLLSACASTSSNGPKAEIGTTDTTQATLKGSGDPRCDGTVKGRELSEYDTSGDEVADVRKVFVRAGEATLSRLIMICREADVNRDGRKDVARVYDDEGRSLREDSDRNFDGKWDQITSYQNGEIVVQEFDDNFDGRIDTKLFYEHGKPLRAERDLSGRSSTTQWRPDRWEYFEGGKMVRMGTDLDGDTRVDHWDRDAAWKRAQDAAKAQVAGTNAD